ASAVAAGPVAAGAHSGGSAASSVRASRAKACPRSGTRPDRRRKSGGAVEQLRGALERGDTVGALGSTPIGANLRLASSLCSLSPRAAIGFTHPKNRLCFNGLPGLPP